MITNDISNEVKGYGYNRNRIHEDPVPQVITTGPIGTSYGGYDRNRIHEDPVPQVITTGPIGTSYGGYSGNRIHEDPIPQVITTGPIGTSGTTYGGYDRNRIHEDPIPHVITTEIPNENRGFGWHEDPQYNPTVIERKITENNDRRHQLYQ